MIDWIKGRIKQGWIKVAAIGAAIFAAIVVLWAALSGRKQSTAEQTAQEEKERIEAHHKEQDKIEADREKKIEVLKKKQGEDHEKAQNDEKKDLDELINEVDREIADTPRTGITFDKDKGGYHV